MRHFGSWTVGVLITLAMGCAEQPELELDDLDGGMGAAAQSGGDGDSPGDGDGDSLGDGDGSAQEDCAGTPGGEARMDRCGICNDIPENDCIQDCAGQWGGDAYQDECGVCDDDPENDCVQDCAGDWGGDSYEDYCGICDDNADNDCITDPQIELGGNHSCYLNAQGRVHCWGDNQHGQAAAPDDTKFLRISADYEKTCGVRADDHLLQCWGRFHASWDPTDQPITDIEVGSGHACAILQSNGTVTCWPGSDSPGPKPPNGLVARSLAGSNQTYCAITEPDGHLTCWGQAPYEDGVPSGAFDEIAATAFHACGIRTSNKQAVCWWMSASVLDRGQTDASAGSFQHVAAGAYYTCGILENDQLICWGGQDGTDGGAAAPPAGAMSALSAGTQHACAISVDDGSVVCWGNDDLGQASPPDTL